jgi:K+-sensing histidine kinase KdpD
MLAGRMADSWKIRTPRSFRQHAASSPRAGQASRMTRSDLAQQWPKSQTTSYAVAVLSVAGAIIATDAITRLLHAESIGLSMLCAVIFVAWIGGFGPALLAVTLALLSFHYYLVPPGNSFVWKSEVLALLVPEAPRLLLFCATSLIVAPRRAFCFGASWERWRNSDSSSSLIVPFMPSSKRSFGWRGS